MLQSLAQLFLGGFCVSNYTYYNPNPLGHHRGDCTVRALCKATDCSWDYVHSVLCAISNAYKDMPSADHVYGVFLRMQGFKRYIVDDHDQDVYTVRDFCEDNPEGTYILAIAGHVVCVVDGVYYDSWDSGGEIPLYYWKQ